MKIQEEKIIFEEGYSFKSFTPSLNECFFWHSHPEIELVYIETPKGRGIRHVGKHISDFTESDLILIGPNVPHLNFDYGIKTDYNQIVVQIKDSFVNEGLVNVPEFNRIKVLLESSFLGFSFKGETKEEVGKMLKELKSDRKLGSLLDLIKILQILANSKEVEELNTEDTRAKLFSYNKVRMDAIYEYIHENYHKRLTIDEVAHLVHLSSTAFCRYFKKQTNLTFTNFINRYRINMAKAFLLQDFAVGDVCYKVGFESISYFCTLFKKLVGESPTNFKNRFLHK
ncbi:AraC family transcriptional regulator [Chryseobacterium nematophagum]|uniref:AraC family transcriptional regulator n=1 Tax=Chryseobacterium nematophagum TaxID=2305228 RepID=A0A3M7TGI5_9FLAO|nr:AraC family transcriptional regulator [Chryseobacterium nematophagum]RNA61739.1 AraC family transcriptional regulator [Chryseobacterium nematophagum]